MNGYLFTYKMVPSIEVTECKIWGLKKGRINQCEIAVPSIYVRPVLVCVRPVGVLCGQRRFLCGQYVFVCGQ